MAVTRTALGTSEVTLTQYVERGLEFLWLLTAAAVPLIFLKPEWVLSEAVNAYVEVPKTAALRTLAGLMAILWIVEWVLKGGLEGRLGKWVLLLALEVVLLYFTGVDGVLLLAVHVFLVTFLLGSFLAFGLGTFNILPYPGRLKGWVVQQPSRLLVVAAVVYVAAAITATIFSQNFWISVWGEVSAQFGYSAYTTVSYFIVFAVVATHLKTPTQLWRLLAVIVVTGVLLATYGTVQHYDLDPLNLGETGADRISATMANPVFAGATFVITSLMIIGLGLTVLERLGWSFLRVAVWAALIAMQLLVIFWTEARGSWIVGLPAGLAAYLVLSPLANGLPSLGNWARGHFALAGLLGLMAGLVFIGQLVMLGQLSLPGGLTGTQLLLGIIAILGLLAVVNVSGGVPGWLTASVFLGQLGLLILLFFLDSLVFIGLMVPLISISLLMTLAPLSSTQPTFRLGPVTKTVLVLALGLQIALAVVFLTPDPSGAAGVGQVQERVSEITSASSERGVSFRTDIWSASARLVFKRPWFGFEDLDYYFLPWVTGYGPEMFKYTLPLESPLGGLLSQAHNFFLHHALEQGALGFLTSVGLFLAFFAVGFGQLWNNRNTYTTLHKWILITLLATMVGRLAEMLVGVSREPDLILTWLMFAVLVALPTVMRPSTGNRVTSAPLGAATAGSSPELSEGAPTPAPASRKERRRDRSRRRDRRGRRGTWSPGELTLHKWTGIVLASVIILFLGWLSWDKNVDYVWAAWLADDARDNFQAGRFQDGQRQMLQAIDKAPDVPPYYHNLAGIYDAYRRFGESNPDQQLPTCEEFYSLETRPAQSDRPFARCAEESYLTNLAGFEKNRTVPQTRLTLANSTLQLALVDRAAYESKDDEAIQYHEELIQMFAKPWHLYNALGNAHVRLRQFSEALAPLDTSLTLTAGDTRSAQAFFLKGIVFRNLADMVTGDARLADLESASGFFSQSLDSGAQGSTASQARDHLSTAYDQIAAVYIEQDRHQEALDVVDKSLAINQESSSSGPALYFQGVAYRELGETQMAIDSLMKSLSLDENGQYSVSAHQQLDFIYNNMGQEALSFYHRGITQQRLNNREHAIDAFEKSLAASGDNPVSGDTRTRLVSTLNELALALMSEDEPEGALPLLEKSLEITQDSSDSGTALYIQGVAHQQLEDLESAVASLELSLELDGTGPNAINVHRQLSEVFEELGDQAKADEHARLAEQLGQS